MLNLWLIVELLESNKERTGRELSGANFYDFGWQWFSFLNFICVLFANESWQFCRNTTCNITKEPKSNGSTIISPIRFDRIKSNLCNLPWVSNDKYLKRRWNQSWGQGHLQNGRSSSTKEKLHRYWVWEIKRLRNFQSLCPQNISYFPLLVFLHEEGQKIWERTARKILERK